MSTKFKKLGKKFILCMLLASTCFSTTGCVRPYMKPVFEEVEANETAFLVPMSDSGSDQAKFESVEYLEERKVAAKRVELKQEWVQTGRINSNGYYQPSERLIKVSRTPVTREWTNASDTGSSTARQAVEAETLESIPFSANITAVAQIEEPDTATFLYLYQGKSLEEIMDSEIKTTIHSAFVCEAAKYTLEDILSKKEDIMETIRNQVIPYFKERGITITTIGLLGSFEYSKEIQESIDQNFKSKKAVETAENNAKAKLAEAKGDVAAIEAQKSYLKEIIELRRLENEANWIEKWDSHLPTVMSGSDSSSIMYTPDLGKLNEEAKKGQSK